MRGDLQDVFEDDDNVHLVMELCSGGPILERVKAGKVSERDVASIIRSVLRFIAQCHSRGIIYRDVKPDNFLFLSNEPDSPIRATDFGLSIRYEPLNPVQAFTSGMEFLSGAICMWYEASLSGTPFYPVRPLRLVHSLLIWNCLSIRYGFSIRYEPERGVVGRARSFDSPLLETAMWPMPLASSLRVLNQGAGRRFPLSHVLSSLPLLSSPPPRSLSPITTAFFQCTWCELACVSEGRRTLSPRLPRLSILCEPACVTRRRRSPPPPLSPCLPSLSSLCTTFRPLH